MSSNKFKFLGQGSLITAINTNLITTLVNKSGICSGLCDYYLYVETKVASGGMKAEKNYTGFINYLERKLEYDPKKPEKLEKFAKFINVSQSFNNSMRDIEDNKQTPEVFYNNLKKNLDEKSLLKVSFDGHDIVIFKREGAYGYLNSNNNEEVTGLTYEEFKKAFKDIVSKNGLFPFIRDIEDNVGTITIIEYDEQTPEVFYNNLKKNLDEKSLLKALLDRHGIVIFKRGGAYGYFDPNEDKEVTGLTYEKFKEAFKDIVSKNGLLTSSDNKKALYIHDGKARVKAMFANKDIKQALTEFFDSEIAGEKYKKILEDNISKASSDVSNHMKALQTRIEKVNQDDQGVGTTKQAKERYKDYLEAKTSYQTYLENTKIIDVNKYDSKFSLKILRTINEEKRDIVKLSVNLSKINKDEVKFIVEEMKILVENNYQIIVTLEEVIDTEKKVSYIETLCTQKEALFLFNQIKIECEKFPKRPAWINVQIVKQLMCKAKKKIENLSDIYIGETIQEFELKYLLECRANDQKIKNLEFSRKLNAIEQELVKKIIKEKNIEQLTFHDPFSYEIDLFAAISENKNIKLLRLDNIKETTNSAIENLGKIVQNHPSITSIALEPCNDNYVLNNLLEAIENNINIKNLSLRGSELDDKASNKLAKIIYAGNITSIDLSYTRVNNPTHILTSLIQNTSIKELKINVGDISNDAMINLLKKNQYEALSIAENDFSGNQWYKLFEAMENNTALKHLEFFCCTFDDAAKESILEAVAKNPSIESVDLAGANEDFAIKIKNVIEKRNYIVNSELKQPKITSNIGIKLVN